MSEATTARTKRTGTRFFKNPPQPYMCIGDTLMGSTDPCYVNVLSWDQVAFSGSSSDDVPLYGGMKIYPPRTERREVSIFAVMAHPDALKRHGKNTHNPKERTRLIDALLDFVELTNSGVVFSRRYRVLPDRDITGELKEIWMAVQTERAKSQQGQMTMDEEGRLPPPQREQHQTQQQYSVRQDHGQQQQERTMQEVQRATQRQEEQDEQRRRLEEDRTSQPPQYQTGLSADEDRSETAEHRSRYVTHSQNEGKVVDCATAVNYSPNTSRDVFGVPLNSQIQQQRYASLIPDDQIPQPPQYHSSVFHEDYGVQDGNFERRARPHCVDTQNYTIANKYRVIPAPNDHYIFSDASASTNSQEHTNSLPYQAYQYQSPGRLMGQPYATGVNPGAGTNCTTPGAPTSHGHAEAMMHRYNVYTSVKEILETMNRNPSQHRSTQSSHIQTMQTGNTCIPNQVTSLPRVVVLRHDEPENRMISPDHVTRTRFAPPSQPRYAHLGNSSPRPSRPPPSTTTRESNPKKSCALSFLKMIADRSADVSQDEAASETTIADQATRLEQLKIDDTTRVKVLRRDDPLNEEKHVPRETSKPPTSDGSSGVREEESSTHAIPASPEDRLTETRHRDERNGSVHSALRIVPTISVSNSEAKILLAGESDEANVAKKTNGRISNDETIRTYTILRKPEVNASQKRVTGDTLQMSINESLHRDKFVNKSVDKRSGRLRKRR